MNQLFQIDGDTWKALSEPEILATIEGMKECGICQLPYPRVDLRMPLDVCAHTSSLPKGADLADLDVLLKFLNDGLIKLHPEIPGQYGFNFGHDSWLDVKNLSFEDMNYYTSIRIGRKNPNFGECCMMARDQVYNTEHERNMYAYALIVLLGTRNAVKTTKHRKCVGLGIGAKPGVYEYTTTITLPRELEDETGEAAPGSNGASKKPHLRRGHPRRQRFGPSRQFSEVRWIEPVFVNADPDWVDKRRAYNVSV